jgi:sugar/nucleoside kinase (ribokinase family)
LFGKKAVSTCLIREEVSLDILGLGCVAVDDLLYLAAYPAADTKVPVRRRERQCGGLTATALVAASRLGASCAYAGVLGFDEASQFVVDTLQREQIDVRYLRRHPEARPIRSTILVDESCLTRTILFDLAGSVGADPDWPTEQVIRSARLLYVDHYGIEGMIRAATIAHTASIPVVADLERNEWPGFDRLLTLVDHLIVSHDFAVKLTGQSDPARVVDKLWTEGRQSVVVTRGPEGCWYRGRSVGISHHPAFAVEAVDSTGCGDVFHGAYAAALARGLELPQRIRFASAAAALKATRHGAQAGIPPLLALEQFLQQND